MLASPDFRARAAAVRVLVAWRDRLPDWLDLLAAAVNDERPRVRLMAVWAASYATGKDVPPRRRSPSSACCTPTTATSTTS